MFNVLIIIEDYTPCSSMEMNVYLFPRICTFILYIDIIWIIIEDCTRCSSMKLNVYLFP